MIGSRTRAVVGAALALTVAACSGGGGGSGGAYKEPAGESLKTAKIDAGNFFFKPEKVTLPAGINTIQLVGRGGVHTLVIDGVNGFQLRVDGDGQRDAKKIALKPGSYTFSCDIPGHRDAGMEGKIRVS